MFHKWRDLMILYWSIPFRWSENAIQELIVKESKTWHILAMILTLVLMKVWPAFSIDDHASTAASPHPTRTQLPPQKCLYLVSCRPLAKRPLAKPALPQGQPGNWMSAFWWRFSFSGAQKTWKELRKRTWQPQMFLEILQVWQIWLLWRIIFQVHLVSGTSGLTSCFVKRFRMVWQWWRGVRIVGAKGMAGLACSLGRLGDIK